MIQNFEKRTEKQQIVGKWTNKLPSGTNLNKKSTTTDSRRLTQKIANQRSSDIYVVFTKIFCGRNFYIWYVTKLKFTGQLQMASLSLYAQFDTNLMSNRKVIELLLRLKSGRTHGKDYIKARPPLVRHL